MTLPVRIGDTNTQIPGFGGGRRGPFLVNGAYYYVADQYGLDTAHYSGGLAPRVFKATDPTSAWVAQDTAHEPVMNIGGYSGEYWVYATDCQVVGNMLHIAWVWGAVNGQLQYSRYDCSTNTWTLNETVGPNNLRIKPAGIAVRSNGDVIIGVTDSYDNTAVYYKRTTTWAASVSLGTDDGGIGMMYVALGASDRAHFFWCTSAGHIRHRSLSSADALDTVKDATTDAYASQQVAGGVTAYNDGGTYRVRMLYNDTNNKLRLLKCDSGANPTFSSEAVTTTEGVHVGDSSSVDQAEPALANDGSALQAIWARKSDTAFCANSSAGSYGGSWGADTVLHTMPSGGTQPAFTAGLYQRGTNIVLGYVYFYCASYTYYSYYDEVALRPVNVDSPTVKIIENFVVSDVYTQFGASDTPTLGLRVSLLVEEALNISTPQVFTGQAIQVAKNSAILSGTINPAGAPATWYFQFGTTELFGNETYQLQASENRARTVEAAVTNLVPGSTYYFRLVGANIAGTAYGDDMEFQTPPEAQSPIPPPPPIGHIIYPGSLAADGSWDIVEQDSLGDVQQCVRVLLHTPLGIRPLAPLVGVTDPTFVGVDADDLMERLNRDEPRGATDVVVAPPAGYGEEQDVTITVELLSESESREG